MNKYYEFYDGWFTYFVNVKTGEKKFELEGGDILVDCNGRVISDGVHKRRLHGRNGAISR